MSTVNCVYFPVITFVIRGARRHGHGLVLDSSLADPCKWGITCGSDRVVVRVTGCRCRSGACWETCF